MKKWSRLLLASMMVCLMLGGCGKSVPEEMSKDTSTVPPLSSVAGVSKNVVNKPVLETEEDWNPAIIQRQILVDEGAMCGVFFLGYAEESAGDLETNREYYRSIFEENGYLEAYPFLEEIPNSNYIQTEHGQELYCIIPQDVRATVSVNQWITDPDKGFEGKTGEVLYRSEEGSPILLRCNASELVSDVEIVIVDGNGRQMRWNPALSGMDSKVMVEPAEGAVWDFTLYDEEDMARLLTVMVAQDFEYYWDKEYETTLAYVNYPNIKIREYDQNTYSELAQCLVENLKSRKDKLYSNYENAIVSARNDYPDMIDYFREYESSESAMIRRADSSVLSVLYSGFQFEGGIHGYSYYWGENYDTETGTLLGLTDVVNDINEFSKYVEEQLYTHWEKEVFYEDLDLEQYVKENLDMIPWTLDYHGVTVYFNPFDIAPYATGIQDVTVAFDVNPGLFNEKYLNVPAFYGIQLDMNIPFYYDVDGDGELDEILVYGIPNEYGYVVHNVHVDQECFVELDEDDIYAYAIFSPHMLHMEDGRNYLMIENQTDNDYRTNTIYELTSGIPVKTGTILSGIHTTVDNENDLFFKDALTNPYSFRMDSRTWCVGTYDGYMTYYLDSDGFPLSYEDYYTFEIMPEFKVQKNFKLNLVNEYGEIGEAVTVKAGETVKYYRTDSSMFADFILPDGRIGRADLEWFEGLCSIDGNTAEELFDGIVFAG